MALVRRRYKYEAEIDGRPLQLYRATRATAWLYPVMTVGWLLLITAIKKDLTALNGGLDMWMRVLQLVLIVALVGTIIAFWNAYVVANAPGRHRLATVGQSSWRLRRRLWGGCASMRGC